MTETVKNEIPVTQQEPMIEVLVTAKIAGTLRQVKEAMKYYPF